MPLTVHFHDSGHMVACVHGALTINAIDELKDDLFGLLNAADVALDLSQVTEYDGCGLQTLALLLDEAARAQRRLRIDPVHAGMAHAMQLLGFHALPGATSGSGHGPD